MTDTPKSLDNDEIIDQAPPIGKVFKDKTFWTATFLGGPLAAGYLFAENFKALNQPHKVRPTWIIAIIMLVLVLSLAFLIPDSSDFPGRIIPFVYTGIASLLFLKYQGKSVESHINAGGQVHTWGRVTIVGLIGLVLTVAPIFAIIYLPTSITQPNLTTKTYGNFVKHEIDFDKTNLSEQEVDFIAEGFTNAGFFDAESSKFLYIEKDQNVYKISISCIPGIENDAPLLEAYEGLRQDMDRHLSNNQVEFLMTVEYLENVVKVLK